MNHNMKFYLVCNIPTYVEINKNYEFISKKIIFKSDEEIITLCETDFLTCARIDQQFALKTEIYHTDDKWPDMDNVSIDICGDSVILAKDGLIAKASIFGDLEDAKDQAMLLLKAMIDTKEFLEFADEDCY